MADKLPQMGYKDSIRMCGAYRSESDALKAHVRSEMEKLVEKPLIPEGNLAEAKFRLRHLGGAWSKKSETQPSCSLVRWYPTVRPARYCAHAAASYECMKIVENE